MSELDILTSNQQLMILKFMLPYMPASYHKMLSIYIKFAELQNAIYLFGNRNRTQNDPLQGKDIHSPSDILEALRPVMSQEDAKTMDMLLNAMSMMNMMKDMDIMNNMDMSDFSGFVNPDDMSEMMDLVSQITKGSDTEHE